MITEISFYFVYNLITVEKDSKRNKIGKPSVKYFESVSCFVVMGDIKWNCLSHDTLNGNILFFRSDPYSIFDYIRSST